jgi:hypothetical protein
MVNKPKAHFRSFRFCLRIISTYARSILTFCSRDSREHVSTLIRTLAHYFVLAWDRASLNAQMTQYGCPKELMAQQQLNAEFLLSLRRKCLPVHVHVVTPFQRAIITHFSHGSPHHSTDYIIRRVRFRVLVVHMVLSTYVRRVAQRRHHRRTGARQLWLQPKRLRLRTITPFQRSLLMLCASIRPNDTTTVIINRFRSDFTTVQRAASNFSIPLRAALNLVTSHQALRRAANNLLTAQRESNDILARCAQERRLRARAAASHIYFPNGSANNTITAHRARNLAHVVANHPYLVGVSANDALATYCEHLRLQRRRARQLWERQKTYMLRSITPLQRSILTLLSSLSLETLRINIRHFARVFFWHLQRTWPVAQQRWHINNRRQVRFLRWLSRKP